MPGRSAVQPRRHKLLVVAAAFTHLLLFFIVPVTTAAQSDDGLLHRQTDGRSRCNINCSDKPRPLCGSDDRTYNSRCELDKYNQCNKDSAPVVIKYRGKCSVEETQCRIDREQALRNRRQKQTLEFVPECKDDGSFAEVQCHKQSGYCWCVTDKGKPVPKSSKQYERPNCSNQGRATSRRSSRGRKERKGCGQADRSAFNDNLLKIFMSEYKRLPTPFPHSTAKTPSLDTEEGRVTEWKFNELDKNGDRELDKKELRELKRMVKKIVRPRSCARTFTKYCDQDQDRKISRSEWSLCLGVGMNYEQVDPGSKAKPHHTEQEDGPSPERKVRPQDTSLRPADTTFKPTEDDITDCLRDRQYSLEENSHSQNKFFVPECTSEGKYNKVQCYKAAGYCWCVEQETGKMIQGTTLMNSHPNCDKQPRMKNIKGCPDQKKRRFILDLLEVLYKDMMAANTSLGANQQPTDGDVIRYEKAALWKFNKLDSNNNKGIDRKEWKDFKNDIKKRKGLLRKCGRNFLKYCDENNDKKVSTEEWISCLNLNKGQVIPAWKPKGDNPIKILNGN